MNTAHLYKKGRGAATTHTNRDQDNSVHPNPVASDARPRTTAGPM